MHVFRSLSTRFGRISAVCAVLAGAWVTLSRGAVPSAVFKYNVLEVTNSQPGQTTSVRFSVTDPTNGDAPYDITVHDSFKTANGARLFIQIGWDTRDYHNSGSQSETLNSPKNAAQPIPVNALASPQKHYIGGVWDGSFVVTAPRPIPATAQGSGNAAMEGRLVELVGGAWVQVAVRSAFKFFAITDPSPVPRRAVVDVNKCKNCHGSVAPPLVVHGNNRVEEVMVCVGCHNPNATDIAYRTSGKETPIDFKNMIHAIHAGRMRHNPEVIIGFGGSVNDFSYVDFPASLADCQKCHIPGAYSLPLGNNVLGTTVDTRSVIDAGGKVVDGDPTNDLNITPTAAVCSACHDGNEARRHMEEKGASFAVLQQNIGSGKVRERCANCHGAGRQKDVVKVHAEEARESSSGQEVQKEERDDH